MISSSSTVLRGMVYMIDVYDEADNPIGEKPVVIVSNNGRNRNLDNYLAVRITTTEPIPGLATQVPIVDSGIKGHARCDDVLIIYRDELKRQVCGLSAQDLVAIGSGLKQALAL